MLRGLSEEAREQEPATASAARRSRDRRCARSVSMAARLERLKPGASPASALRLHPRHAGGGQQRAGRLCRDPCHTLLRVPGLTDQGQPRALLLLYDERCSCSTSWPGGVGGVTAVSAGAPAAGVKRLGGRQNRHTLVTLPSQFVRKLCAFLGYPPPGGGWGWAALCGGQTGIPARQPDAGVPLRR